MKKIRLAVFSALFILLASPAFAQGPPDPEDTPIDGGLALLVAAGAAYGVKKYREGKRDKVDELIG